MLVEKRVQHVASSRHDLSTLTGFQEKFFCKDLLRTISMSNTVYSSGFSVTNGVYELGKRKCRKVRPFYLEKQ